MTKKRGSTYFKLWVSLIIVFIALGLTFVACKPAEKAEEKVTEPISVPKEEPPVVSGKATFKWIPVKAGTTKAQISIGRGVVCPFEFSGVGSEVKKVKLSIKEEKIAKMGVIVADEETEIKDSKIASSVMFSVPPGTRLGNYELTIQAKDAATGVVIGEGVIPFQILPKGAAGC